MQESHPFHKALAAGVSVLVISKVVQPEVKQLHDTVVNIDRMASLMLKRGEFEASKLNKNIHSFNSSNSSKNCEKPDASSSGGFFLYL